MTGIAPGFTGSPLNRADQIRTDPDALAREMMRPSARALVLNGLDPVIDDEGRLAWKSLADTDPEAELIFLGLDGSKPCFVELTSGGASGPLRSPALFRAIQSMAAGEAGTYAAARSLVDWHRRHRFCAVSGHPTVMFRGGWGRRCPDCNAEHFPRTDPVVIMLAQHEDRVLVGRQPGFPPGRYSALAGFLEPGESIEEAVARELHEEAGVSVANVRYIASQPWPFPSSLMIACVADAADDALVIDTTELEDAIWVSRAGVAAAMAGDASAPFIAPPPYAIAHTLFRAWLDQDG